MNYKLISFFLLLSVCSLSVQAKMYKWEDEDGNVHFGDRIPTQYLNKGHKELNAQGAVVGTHDEVKVETEEEKQEKYRLLQAEKEKERKVKEKARQDQVLLDTYTTERDLTAARDARLDAVNSQLQLSKSIIEDAKRKLDATERQIATIKGAGNEVPKNIISKMKREERQLKTYQDLVASHEKRKQGINEQFGDYIKRFRELKIEQQRIKDEREARRKGL